MNKPYRGVVIGYPHWVNYLARLVNERSSKWRLSAFKDTRVGALRVLLALRDAEALICVGGPGPNSAFAQFARQRNVPIIVIWMGTDVMRICQDPARHALEQTVGGANFAVSQHLADELRHAGIAVAYVPIIGADAPKELVPFPERFSVLTYLPEPRRAFYGVQHVYAAATALPDVRFTVVGTGHPDRAAPPNVTFAGHVSDIPRRIEDCVVLLRLPEHDGMPGLVLETLARGRHVIWTYTFPGVHRVRDAGEAISVLQQLRDSHGAGTLDLNYEGRDYVRGNFSHAPLASGFEAALDRVVAERRGQLRATRKSVAISGSGSCNESVARLAERFHPNWSPNVLATGSRLETLTALWALSATDVWYSIGRSSSRRALSLAARLWRKPHVIHWVKGDVKLIRDNELSCHAAAGGATSHLAEDEFVAGQLAELGIHARPAPLPDADDTFDERARCRIDRIVEAWELASSTLPQSERSSAAT